MSGTFRPVDGQTPAPVETVRLAIYSDESGGVPLWEEIQTVRLGADGRYQILLGETQREGVPLEVFASGEARWLGMVWSRPGEVEGPRVRITSVPYALRASDADTLGGKPASAYLLAPASDTATHASTTTAGTSATATAASVNPASIINPGTVNQVAKYVNASDLGPSAIFESGGFVGLNTATPQDYLHIRFTNTAGAFTGLAVQNLGSTATSYSGTLFYDHLGNLGQFQGFNNITHEYRINNIAQSSGVFNGSINFMIGSTSRFLVESNGNVGIGTTAPIGILDVSNALIPTSANASVATTSYTGTNPTGSRFIGRHARGTVGAPSALQNGDNLVGFVGQGYGATGFSTGRAGMFVQAAENWTDTAQGTNLVFTTTPVGTTTQIQQMTIDQAGNVGIGNQSPKNALEVVRSGTDATIVSTAFSGSPSTAGQALLGLESARGTIAAPLAVQTGDVLGALIMNGYGATHFGDGVAGVGAMAAENWTDAAQGTAMGFLTTPLGAINPLLYMAILPNGNVGIGTPQNVDGTPTATDRLQVFGDVRVGISGTNGCVKRFDGTGITGTCSSDRRLKKNITPFGSALDQVTALQPVHFNWRADEFPDRHFGDSRAYGLVAQDVEQVLPELVVTGEDGFKQVDYSKLPLLTIQAVKELKAQHDTSKERVRELKAENEDLKERVAELERLVREIRATTSQR